MIKLLYNPLNLYYMQTMRKTTVMIIITMAITVEQMILIKNTTETDHSISHLRVKNLPIKSHRMQMESDSDLTVMWTH